MRMSKLFGRTLREIPAEAEVPSHQLLIRAGMIRPLGSGIYSFLPLAQKSALKIEKIMRQEMDKIGGQEVNMPLAHPAELWQESGRWQEIGRELLRFKDRADHDMVLAMTHEEAVTDLLRGEVNSYRQLPMMVYQIKLKFRDEPRPRGGLVRVREFTMKDAYSFHTQQADLDEYYLKVYQAYLNIFHRCGLDVIVVESDTGMMGGTAAHEFMLVTDSGEDKLILCDLCKYAANADVAVSQKKPVDNGPPLNIEPVSTPNKKTIEEVANYLGVEKFQTLKAVFYSSGSEVIFVGLRGDLEVNETKLKNTLKIPQLTIASEKELTERSIVAGYASPIGVKNVKVVIDDSVANSSNLVAGANQEGYHLKNVNFPRDFKADVVTDIALVQDGDVCSHCGSRLKSVRGIEVGNIFKLGTKYSVAMGASYLDKDGSKKPVVMGCYGIGVGRLLASIVEQNHDPDGIIWPMSVAPYLIYLLHIGADKDNQVMSKAAELYAQLQSEDFEVLYDDRDDSPGVKFKDADLIGIPIRITISQRTLKEDAVEVKLRKNRQAELVKFGQLHQKLKEAISYQRSAL